MSEAKTKDLVSWIQSTLGAKVKSVKASHRLVNTPAVITDHESASFRRMMKHVEANNEMSHHINKSHNLEINPTHFIIKNLNKVRETDPTLAKEVLEQVTYDTLLYSCVWVFIRERWHVIQVTILRDRAMCNELNLDYNSPMNNISASLHTQLS